ncbi:hypothetical protein SELMODRAFT_55016, partial [Selaginella moellendorffii]
DVVTWNMIISSHAQSGDVAAAKRLFDSMPERSFVSWNTMAAAYVRNSDPHSTKGIFDRMPLWNTVAWNTLITAYSQVGHFQTCLQIFYSMPHWDVFSCNYVITALSNLENLSAAISLFDSMPLRNVYTMPMWNLSSKTAMLQALAQSGCLDEAEETFHSMASSTVNVDMVCWTSMIIAYSIHGSIDRARDIFDLMPRRDCVCWNVMVGAYAQNGATVDTLRAMLHHGIPADHVVFNSLLFSCGHSGLVALARESFVSMRHEHSLEAGLDHYTRMLGILARAGQIEEALDLLQAMPYRPNDVTWTTFLSA